MLALSGTFLSQLMDSSWTPLSHAPLPLCLPQTEEPGDLPESKKLSLLLLSIKTGVN